MRALCSKDPSQTLKLLSRPATARAFPPLLSRTRSLSACPATRPSLLTLRAPRPRRHCVIGARARAPGRLEDHVGANAAALCCAAGARHRRARATSRERLSRPTDFAASPPRPGGRTRAPGRAPLRTNCLGISRSRPHNDLFPLSILWSPLEGCSRVAKWATLVGAPLAPQVLCSGRQYCCRGSRQGARGRLCQSP